MARLEFSGTQELMDELFAESERVDRLAPQMLREAGEVVVDAWKEAITEAGHAPPGKSGRATGDLLASVKATGVKKKGDGYTSEVYPQGKGRGRQRMAEVAFVLHYGTSKMKGDHFVDQAEAKAEEAVQAVMEQIWNRD